MKTSVIVLLLLAAGAGNAWADRDRGHFDAHFGVMIGPTFGPYWQPWYAPMSPYAYYPPAYPPVLVAPSAPPVYIQQQAPAASEPGDYYWYYCAAAKGYYPYVKECPGGWQKVSPQPQP